jgi:hypothetical protein
MIYTSNAIINPSFEIAGAGGADVFAWWVEAYGDDGQVEMDSAQRYEGSYSCKITATSTGAASPGVTIGVEVEAGEVFDLSFAVRGDGANNGRFLVYDTTNSANVIALSSVGHTAASWAVKTYTVTVPAGCERITLSLYTSGTGTGGVTWFDDVKLQKHITRMPVICGFGDTYATMVDFPPYDAQVPHGAGTGTSSRIILPGGQSYDWGRAEILPPPPAQDITIQGEWIAADDAEMARIDALINSLLNVRSKLWREFGDDNVHWRWARCVGVQGELSARENLYYATYTLEFECDAGPWHGQDRSRTWTLSSGANPATIVCRNYGNAPVRDVKMTVTAGSADMTTQVSVSHRVVRDAVAANGYTSWYVGGTIGAGLALVIDNSEGTIKLDGADDYANMIFDEGYQMVPDWFYFEPGRNSLVFTWAGGGTGSTVLMEYEDGWL